MRPHRVLSGGDLLSVLGSPDPYMHQLNGIAKDRWDKLEARYRAPS